MEEKTAKVHQKHALVFTHLPSLLYASFYRLTLALPLLFDLTYCSMDVVICLAINQMNKAQKQLATQAASRTKDRLIGIEPWNYQKRPTHHRLG